MKKLICLAMALACIFLFASCAAGASVPYRTIQLANRYSEIFSEQSGIVAFRETLDYGDYTYSVYCEKAESGKLLTYNIAETAPGYALYARQGKIFMEKNGKKYALLQISGTYSDFVGKYAQYDHPLDAGSHYQVRSEKRADGGYDVTYKSQITPQSAGELADYGVELGEYIFSRHIVDKNYFCLSVEYSVGKSEGERILLKRSFEYYTEPQDAFADVPKDGYATVKIIYSGARSAEFSVPKGYFLGFDMPDVSYDFFLDADLTEIFDAENAPIEENTVLYARARTKSK